MAIRPPAKKVLKSRSHLFCIRSSENICSFPEVFGALRNSERAVQKSPWVNITARCTGRFFLFPRRISCHCFFKDPCGLQTIMLAQEPRGPASWIRFFRSFWFQKNNKTIKHTNLLYFTNSKFSVWPYWPFSNFVNSQTPWDKVEISGKVMRWRF